MAIASLLTFLALIGVVAGSLIGQARTLSCYLTAAGGGLLFGISLFWLIPESAAASGWLSAGITTAAACVALALAERFLVHGKAPSGHAAFGPLLVATAIHSFLDGWSVRALAAERLASVAVPLGLALHKIPEGAAIGWIARRSLPSAWQAALAAMAVESVTLLGAYIEPQASRSGFAAFGLGWTSVVFAIIGGSFLFVGLHAVLPNRRRVGVMLVFVATFLIVGSVGLLKGGRV